MASGLRCKARAKTIQTPDHVLHVPVKPLWVLIGMFAATLTSKPATPINPGMGTFLANDRPPLRSSPSAQKRTEGRVIVDCTPPGLCCKYHAVISTVVRGMV